MNAEVAWYPHVDRVVCEEPVILRRSVRWSECDPAGIVFTPRFLDFCVSAYEAFIGKMLGGPLHAAKEPLGIDFPMRGVEMDFRASLPALSLLEMEVRLGELRSRTFDLHIEGRRLDKAGPGTAFRARLTPITVDRTTRAAVALPASLRAALEDYARQFPFIPETTS